MATVHCFFIPDKESVTDMEGLIDYLGQKISIGCVCLGCNHGFKSPVATRDHMVSKGHTRMSYSTVLLLIPNDMQTEDFEEFEDFYDYTEANVPRRRASCNFRTVAFWAIASTCVTTNRRTATRTRSARVGLRVVCEM